MFNSIVHKRITLSGGEFVLNRGAGIYVVIGGKGKIIGSSFSKTVKTGNYFSTTALRQEKLPLRAILPLRNVLHKKETT